MFNTNVTNLRKNIFGIFEQAVLYDIPVNVATKDGNAIILSATEYNGLLETIRILSDPVMKEKIIDGINTPIEECLPEEEVIW